MDVTGPKRLPNQPTVFIPHARAARSRRFPYATWSGVVLAAFIWGATFNFLPNPVRGRGDSEILTVAALAAAFLCTCTGYFVDGKTQRPGWHRSGLVTGIAVTALPI